jgi:hypothetical protein
MSCLALLVECRVDELINKRIAVREDRRTFHLLSAPVSKEYDAVEYIHNRFVEYHTATMPWKAFQQRFQQFAAKYNKLFTEIRHNRPQIKKKDLKAWLDEAQAPGSYDVGYSEYEGEEDTFFCCFGCLDICISTSTHCRSLFCTRRWITLPLTTIQRESAED